MISIIIGDPHINDSSIEELENIFQEILKLKGDRLICLGDWFDKNKPSPSSLFFGTKYAQKFLKRFKEFVILRGNHDQMNSVNAIDYLEFLGIKVVDNFIDENNNFYGHFMVHQSNLQYGTGKCGIKDLKKYNKCLLGHQHDYQKLSENIYHLGSIRYCSFNEINQKHKVIAILEDDKLSFKKLESPIPMKEVSSILELGKIDERTKVRIIFKNFKTYKNNINKLSQFKDKFCDIKIKLDFTEEKKEIVKSEHKKKNKKDIIESYLKGIEDVEIREILKEEFNETKTN